MFWELFALHQLFDPAVQLFQPRLLRRIHGCGLSFCVLYHCVKSSISKFNSEVPCTFQAERDTSFTFLVAADSPLNLTSSKCYRIQVYRFSCSLDGRPGFAWGRGWMWGVRSGHNGVQGVLLREQLSHSCGPAAASQKSHKVKPRECAAVVREWCRKKKALGLRSAPLTSAKQTSCVGSLHV